MDGSSRFGANNKYGFFPSAAVAWRVLNERFMEDVSLFSDLKLRLSFGTTGNQEIGLYNALSTLSSNDYIIGRTRATGFYPNKVPNPDLKWEKSNEINIGVDLGLFDNRLTLTSDYYYKKTVDLIYGASIPLVTGYSTALQNVGSIQNQGLELAVETNNIVGSNFNWNTSFNISFVSNEVIELGGEEYKEVGAGDGHLKTGSVHRLEVGEPISVFYGYVYDGLFNSEQELDEGPAGPTNWLGGRKYKDLNGDGSIDATNDRTIIGNPHPDFYGGLRNTFSYKGFNLDVFLQFQYGNDILNYNLIDMELPTGGQNQLEEMKNHWSEENPDEEIYPKPTTNRSQVFSSRQIEDGSYLKIQNITFGYNFPHLRNKSQTFTDLRLYLTMSNYFTFTNYSGYDPDISYRGVSNLQIGEDFNQYPRTKLIQIGLEVGF
jgi:TonB-linked SusC/RagA family outer membrane protein